MRTATGGSDGSEYSQVEFDAYGVVESASVSAPGNKHTLLGFAGQYTDGETGLQYLRSRFYDPASGQFTTRDPLVSRTEDPFSYAAANPSAADDPSGMVVRGLCTGQTVTLFIVQGTHQNCVLNDDDGGTVVTDSVGVGFDAVGLGVGVNGGAFYSNADTVDDLEGVDTCASVSVGSGGSAYAEVCVGDNGVFSVSAGGGVEMGVHMNWSGGTFSMNITDLKAELCLKRRAEKQAEKRDARPYRDGLTPSDGQSAGTPGGASPGRPDILGPKF